MGVWHLICFHPALGCQDMPVVEGHCPNDGQHLQNMHAEHGLCPTCGNRWAALVRDGLMLTWRWIPR